MHPHAVIQLPDGSAHELVPGDIIGRMHTAALVVDDGRVSEAHAMVSLRGGDLQLLGLRGAFTVDGTARDQVVLKTGLRVALAKGVALRVLSVTLPDDVLGLEGPDLPLRALPGVSSIVTSPRLRVVRGWDERATARVWSTGEAWRLRVGDGAHRPVEAGDEIEIDGATLRFRSIPLSGAGHSATRRPDRPAASLTIVANYDSVQIHREGRVVLHFGGILARLVSELVAVRGPVAWRVLAAELWPDQDDAAVVRGRLDVNLSRLRRKFRVAGLRPDLVRTDGAGQVELVLGPHDTIEDRT
ncbi:MAG: hypothetical protein AAF799_27190 [Myxococcota bacterium]